MMTYHATRVQWGETGGLSRRPLRVFAFDPMTDRFRDPVVLRVPLEPLRPGPIGRLVEVIDVDLERKRGFDGVDLDDPDVLLHQGLSPSESDPRFHQQMVYAVAMQVLETFERGLGRPLEWSKPLGILPHATRDANVYFDPTAFALVLGVFPANAAAGSANLPGQAVHLCLSYDVIAHELTHPVLWELRKGDFQEIASAGDSDLSAFHESFADLTAVLLRASQASIVERAIRETGHRLEPRIALFSLGLQYGAAMEMGSALRSFPDEPDPSVYETTEDPYARGVTLTSALIDGLLATYREETDDLVGLHGPTRQNGWLHPDFVRSLATECARIAGEMLQAAIAALDFLPPCGLRFGHFLAGFLTADRLLFGRRHARLRAHVIHAFHSRGLVLPSAESLGEEALLCVSPRISPAIRLPYASDALLQTSGALERRRKHMVGGLRPEELEEATQEDLRARQRWYLAVVRWAGKHARSLKLDPDRPIQASGMAGSYRVDADGALRARVVVRLIQSGTAANEGKTTTRRGVTLHCDADGVIEYLIKSHTRDRRGSLPWKVATDRQRQTLANRRLLAIAENPWWLDDDRR
jgi:hypothetical protein